MANELPQTETIRQIAEAWGEAKAQFAVLRQQVDRASRMANAKTQATFIGREKDQAFRDLGEAVWSAVKKGKVTLPPSLASALKAIETIEAREHAQAGEITALLQEGEEAASRMRQKPAPAKHSGVASRPKKR